MGRGKKRVGDKEDGEGQEEGWGQGGWGGAIRELRTRRKGNDKRVRWTKLDYTTIAKNRD